MRRQEAISTKSFELDALTKEKVIRTALKTAFRLGLPIAIWRKPNQSEVNLVISFESALKLNKLDLDQLPKGFLFSPFDFPNKAARFIKSDVNFSFDFEETISNLFQESDNPKKKLFVNEFIEQSDIQNSQLDRYKGESRIESGQPYQDLVNLSVNEIKQGVFDKIVPARTKRIILNEKFDIVEFFFDLSNSYDNAFVSFVSIPEEGTWMGATPETLIEVTKGYFKTVSLQELKNSKDSKPSRTQHGRKKRLKSKRW